MILWMIHRVRCLFRGHQWAERRYWKGPIAHDVCWRCGAFRVSSNQTPPDGVHWEVQR